MDWRMHFGGRNAHEAIRDRLREDGFEFCDERTTPNDPQRRFSTAQRYQEAPKIALEGVRASSTDHETQVIVAGCISKCTSNSMPPCFGLFPERRLAFVWAELCRRQQQQL